MEITGSSETLVPAYETTSGSTPEYRYLVFVMSQSKSKLIPGVLVQPSSEHLFFASHQ